MCEQGQHHYFEKTLTVFEWMESTKAQDFKRFYVKIILSKIY